MSFKISATIKFIGLVPIFLILVFLTFTHVLHPWILFVLSIFNLLISTVKSSKVLHQDGVFLSILKIIATAFGSWIYFCSYVEYDWIIRKIGLLLSDKQYLLLRYRFNMGCRLNLKHPGGFNEKIQWIKLYFRPSILHTLVDKNLVKGYVSDIIGSEHVVKTLQVYDKISDIDFSTLPQKVVLKCTHDSGSTVIIDQSQDDTNDKLTFLTKQLSRNYYLKEREWAYKGVAPQIIAEEFLSSEDGEGLIDYKFFCFDGTPKFLYVSQNLTRHSQARISYMTMDWEFAPFSRTDYTPFETLPQKPENFDKMIHFAELLSKGFPFVRIDFYNITGNIYFSEFTFYPGAGLTEFEPKEWEYRIGDLIHLKSDFNNYDASKG